jgi:hypothetical protein
MKRFDIQENDYVKWYKKGITHEGWVYFKCDEYITIEVGVKPKPYCNLVRNVLHCNDHILVVCHNDFWDEIKYVKSRKSRNEDQKYFIRTVTFSDNTCISK